MNLLQNKIIEASQAYYSGEAIMSDDKFDILLDQLQQESPDDPLLEAVGHGFDIDKLDFGKKFPHRYGPARSLKKCHNFAEFSRLINTSPVVASLKLDGLSVVLYYEEGILTQALTRGSGEGYTGIDITAKILKINSKLSSMSDTSFTGSVRGEIIMSLESFDEFKLLHPSAENWRNSTVGLINNKAISDDLKFLDVIVYNVTGFGSTTVPDKFINYISAANWLKEQFYLSCPTKQLNELTATTFDKVMIDLKEEWYGKFPADGIVISSIEANTNISELSQMDSSIEFQACAFKYKAECIETTVTEVDWNLSKSKYLIPRIKFNTVSLAGTNVSWAHGDNAMNIRTHNIGKGCIVEVCKRGEIIPHVESVISPTYAEIPSVCPCCNTSLIWQGVHLMCPNLDCGDYNVKDTLVWINNISPLKGVGDLLLIKHLSQLLGDNITIDAIYERGQLDSTCTSSKQLSDFITVYNNLFTNKVKLADAVKALNIPRLGDTTSKKLSSYPEIVKQLILGDKTEFSSSERKALGDANCESILSNLDKFKRLRYIMHNIQFEYVDSTAVFEIVVTGKLSMKRKDFETKCQAKQIKLSETLSVKTKYLVTNDPNSASSKNKLADKLNVPKISEIDFISRYLN